MNYRPVNFSEKLRLISEPWTPKIIAELNGQHLKLAKLSGEFVWHRHEDADEAFVVLDGQLRIEFRDGTVDLAAGEMFVVPRGAEHRPVADRECAVLLIEPAGLVNTSDAGGPITAPVDDWI